jgi:membrane-associated phospholipid phosphatase
MSSDGSASSPRPSAPALRTSAPTFERLLAAALVLTITGLGALAWHGHVTRLDRVLTGDLVQQPTSALFHVTATFSQLGSGPVVGLISVIIATMLWRRSGDFFRPLVIMAAGALGGITEIIGKSIVSRLRPPTMVFTGESGFGFPSGHTTGFTAMVVAVAITIPMVINLAASQRTLLRTMSATLALLIAASRVAVGAHYAFDVLAGLCLGTLCALAALYLVLRFTPLASSLLQRFAPNVSRRIAP